MTKPEEFCKDKLFRVTAVQDMKLYNNRIDNLCKREKKCKKKRFPITNLIFFILFFSVYFIPSFLVSFSFKKDHIIIVIIIGRLKNWIIKSLLWLRVSFSSRCISEKVFGLFNIQSADQNFIFFISSRTFTVADGQQQKLWEYKLLQMTKPEEFCKNKLFRITAVQDMKLYNKRIDNLCKREKKCTEKNFLVPIYKICLPKMSNQRN